MTEVDADPLLADKAQNSGQRVPFRVDGDGLVGDRTPMPACAVAGVSWSSSNNEPVVWSQYIFRPTASCEPCAYSAPSAAPSAPM